MMEPAFVNQYQVSFEMYREWASHPVGRNARHQYKKGICLRIILVCCGIFLILIGTALSEFFFVMFGLFSLVTGLLRLFYLPGKILKKQFDLIVKSLNCGSWVNKFTFAEGILCETGKNYSNHDFSEIVKMTEDDGYFYLFYNEDFVMRIYKEGFIVGTVDSFREYCNSVILSHINNGVIPD